LDQQAQACVEKYWAAATRVETMGSFYNTLSTNGQRHELLSRTKQALATLVAGGLKVSATSNPIGLQGFYGMVGDRVYLFQVIFQCFYEIGQRKGG